MAATQKLKSIISALRTGKSIATKLTVRAIALTLFFVGMIISALRGYPTSAFENKLLIGEHAVVVAGLDIPVQMPIELNFRTKADVLELRKRYVELTPNLVAAPYQPSESVFGAIEDGKPWWGLRGQSVWGPGPRSSEGPAEESRFILNPFLLAGANPAIVEIWDEDKVTEEDLQRSDFNQDLNNWRAKLKTDKIIPAFGVAAYNAVDFNLNYVYVDTAKSIHIENVNKPPQEAVKIAHYLHCGGTCQIPGGCNNMSPEMKEIDRIKYTALPARAWVSLWRAKPSNVNVKPDMVVYIDLK